MEKIDLPVKKNNNILALGAESAGIFAVYKNGEIFISDNFGDLLDESNFLKYRKAVWEYYAEKKIKPDAILTDMHPLYKTTILGAELAEKFKSRHVKVQHHLAHIFSSVGDTIILNTPPSLKLQRTRKYLIPNTFIGIAMDGTGYGLDGNIWGGEILKISNDKFPMTNEIPNPQSQILNRSQNLNSKIQVTRIGSLEEQTMIGGDLAVREPARMLIAILARIMNYESRVKNKKHGIINSKGDVYRFVKKYYTHNEFEALYNQMEQDFNCQRTTSTGRVLDAASVLLGFAGNERKFKHEAIKKLEENSAKPYKDIELRIMNHESRKILDTTFLFKYLIKNIKRDKKRLAATAQLYIARGLYGIIHKNIQYPLSNIHPIFAAGGMTNNKIISEYLKKQGVYLSKKIPRGDEGIAVGQVVYYLLNNKR